VYKVETVGPVYVVSAGRVIICMMLIARHDNDRI